ncbi:HWE histidine kinase domain-containing protein [Methylobacterium sp. WL103]|uniref:sensor histidine kinase n=1 Tax=Methylobacterium sp. WL103 TaxID=2603891 RepID=UPI001AEEC606|nr:HWE histidine kinase domain-containing protein [Methylobacterium sp. WL103]
MFVDTPDASAAKNWLAAIVESSDDAIVSKTLEGRISTWNAAAERLFGYSGLEAMGQPIAMLVPECRRDEMPRILDRIRHGDRVEAYDTQRRHKDGHVVDILLRVSPIRDGDGRVIGASKIARDISDRRAAERQQRRLKDELNHRVKNTLMTVQSLVSQTLRSSPDPAAFKEAFETRLIALSRAHDLLERGQWEGVELRDLIARNLAPFAEPDRIGMGGPTVRLGPEATVSLGLAFNELTLNALTVGALAGIDGRLSVTWETADFGDGRGPCLRLDWVERHDRMVGIPTRRGFGRRFLEDALGRQLDGSVTLAFGADGVHCHLDLRLAALHASAFTP